MQKFPLFNALQKSGLVRPIVRNRMLRRAGIDCHPSARIREEVFLGSNKVRFGEGCFINACCFLDGSDWVTIGDNAHLGPGVRIITSSHHIGSAARRGGDVWTAPVIIGAGSWIGAGATILLGVTIAPGCIIGAGALVTKSTEPNGSYKGVPAERHRELP